MMFVLTLILLATLSPPSYQTCLPQYDYMVSYRAPAPPYSTPQTTPTIYIAPNEICRCWSLARTFQVVSIKTVMIFYMGLLYKICTFKVIKLSSLFPLIPWNSLIISWNDHSMFYHIVLLFNPCIKSVYNARVIQTA